MLMLVGFIDFITFPIILKLLGDKMERAFEDSVIATNWLTTLCRAGAMSSRMFHML